MADMSKVGALLAAPADPEAPGEEIPAGDDPEVMGEDAAAMFADAAKSGDAAGTWSAFKMMMQAYEATPGDIAEDVGEDPLA